MNLDTEVVKRILPTVNDFRGFWKSFGPFAYALTSREYPPILLEDEEWLFSNSLTAVIKALMKWDERSMEIVQAPFNVKSKAVIRPQDLSPWRIKNFPEEWKHAACPLFTPTGHLTGSVTAGDGPSTTAGVERAFFTLLADELDSIGYAFLKPDLRVGSPDEAYIDSYLKEWMDDET